MRLIDPDRTQEQRHQFMAQFIQAEVHQAILRLQYVIPSFGGPCRRVEWKFQKGAFADGTGQMQVGDLDLLERVEELRDMDVVITVAGMEGTLPSVVAGLVPGLVIAVPVATGYGVAAHGITALNSALASCAPGLVVVNVDNGYGADCAALRMLNVMQRDPSHNSQRG